MNKRKIGSDMEKLAVGYLEERGYIILRTNFYCGFGELDIVARDGDTLVFVEVKYRKNKGSGMPEEAVDERKIRRIYKCAEYYMYREKLGENTRARFDVIAVEGSEIRHYINAFGGL